MAGDIEKPPPLPKSLYGNGDVITKLSRLDGLPMALRWRASRTEAPL